MVMQAQAAAAELITSGRTEGSLALARTLGRELPGPGKGRTAELWSVLTATARTDLAVVRIIEPHLDALAILDQAGMADRVPDGSTWGVWAAEGPGEPLRATECDEGWRLTGTKHWCSLAADLSHAVVTAHVDGGRRAFAVALGPGVIPGSDEAWVPAGLHDVPTVAVSFEDVPAEPVGGVDWYLTRPGFAWGGMGVAAAWLGGALGVADLLWHQSLARSAPGSPRPLDQVGEAHLGRVAATLHAARLTLADAADRIDAGEAEGAAGAQLALLVRRTVARAAESVLDEVGRATGPGPLTGDAEHVRRVAALTVYIRQEHGERDAAALGRSLLEGESAPW